MSSEQSSQKPQNAEADSRPSHIVGIGASAGGLEAIELLVKNLPSQSGLAYVIVQHLSPDYKSLMAELLAKYTEMPILRIEDGMDVKKDTIYLISPRKNIKLFHGRLLSVEQEDRHKGMINLPIDIFFQSLAEDQGDKAIGIVLSGTGSDGTRGIKAIKENGGMTIAQTPETAKFDSMPNNAISTGLVDYILAPEVMPEQMINFIKHPFANLRESETLIDERDNGLSRIFSKLRERHRVDFTHYKPTTIIRRIERRITVNQCDSLADYNHFIDNNPNEINILFQELLIGVTSFFRDDAVFDFVQEKLISEIIEKGVERGPESILRLWVAGCSTGEEAYSMAMMVADYLTEHEIKLHVKIFATDVDPIAIEKASYGLYPSSIAADVPAKYLSKYFVAKDEYYQVSREIREMVVFAQHDLIKDPPFTEIDLITCRNLLIYLQPVLQRKVLELFNFSLMMEGILVLGSSETLGEMDEFYEPIDNKLKIFRSKGKRNIPGFSRQPAAKSWSVLSPSASRMHHENETLLRFSEERFFNRFIDSLSQHHIIPLTLVVDQQMVVSHIYGESSEFLRYSRGKVVMDLGKVVAQELSIPVTTGVQRCIKTGQMVSLSNIKIRQHGGEVKQVDIQVLPIHGKGAQQESLYTILIREVFHDVEQPTMGISYNIGIDAEQRINDLEQELQFSRESLQATVEELETSNEELQATNEELLASNEELQSTNEELQSVNEELYTVNAEYQNKISELTILNTDMDNLFNSTQTAALFLDENFEIRRFTPKLTEIFPIISTDIGRSIMDLSIDLGKDINLHKIIKRIMIEGESEEIEFQSNTGIWYLLRVTPYAVTKTINSGVVLTLIDINEMKLAQSRSRD
jgi:two-component system CheB/CheR fusion protein